MMTLVAHTRTLTAALIACTLVSAACTTRADNGPMQSQGAKQNQIQETPRDRIQDGGTFTWPIDSMPPQYNYHHVDGTEVAASDVSKVFTLSTHSSDAAGNPVWNPDLLASEPTVVLGPKQVVTFRINPKAAWYDGTPITWEEFLWQWKANNGTDKRYQISSASGWESIEAIERGQDDREVVVTFRNHYADWTGVFSYIYPASTNRDPAIFNQGWKDRPLTTAGPFKLGSIDATAKTVTLVRNERWWGNPAKLDRIVYRAIEPDAQIDAVANGEIDAMDVGPDVNKFNRAQEIEGVDIRMAGGPNFRHLTVNGTSPNLQDVRVRQAMAMAISREAIARAMLAPLGIKAEPLGNHIFMSNQEGYRDNSGEVGAYNPERARQLLDEAGWRLQGKVRYKDGKPLEIVIVIPAAVTTSKQESELMQNMLAQVGIRLIINTVPSQDFFEKYIRPGQFDLTVFSWIGTSYPISSARSIYAQPTRGADGQMDIQQNYSRIGHPDIDRLFDEANAELDRTKAVDLANQLDAKIWEIVHSLTLYQRPEIVVTRSRLANFGAFGFADWTYEDIGWLKP
ncbi:MAG: ABC transporter family substrate-binding protein [Vicinamibacterales bacterium]